MTDDWVNGHITLTFSGKWVKGVYYFQLSFFFVPINHPSDRDLEALLRHHESDSCAPRELGS